MRETRSPLNRLTGRWLGLRAAILSLMSSCPRMRQERIFVGRASGDRSAAREAARYLGCNLRFSLPELGKLRKTGERESERGRGGRKGASRSELLRRDAREMHETTVAGHRGLSRRYNVVTKNRYSDPERETGKSRGSRKSASAADGRRSAWTPTPRVDIGYRRPRALPDR